MLFKSVVVSTLAAAALAQKNTTDGVTGKLGDAAIINDNPVGEVYEVVFDKEGTVKGKITFTAAKNGTGVDVSVDLEGKFDGVEGPYPYHIHALPVPANGSCAATLAHLDPYQRGQKPECDASKPETCEVGDLSGKHGKIPSANGSTTHFHTEYTELYASTKDGIGAFLGNVSVVIHAPNTSRLACANIELKKGSAVAGGNSTSNHTASGKPSGTAAANANGAGISGVSQIVVGGAAIFAAAALL
ncbi:superoxide dismutase [Yarrowia lipolytica]|jgi:hypothetical protein|uniref:superoxide dismutase n=2 Tax=Yarrowia lipolytica TaxID=4952 RepID=Q6C7B0_YARLI|nr:YALI0E02266p [Yarrowia lipolytica CLIB122]AOW04846.1 hypothetical protein YALI1_E02850g [Yarrowia lipolytica]KAB8282899.1 superoxide dismutase [Yarrowia lipolytica]KAE8174622.1 superoxide dismutase [Yarrowia lipolytica]KAJ8056427.1 superoxide dismutase [Yarrowia lipolytica]QNQ00403.1 Cell surface Cu-only superoxide dismutase [Yarrowia lipolytica]|eukprot:XP_503452.1 YALI0E02266p [Yarrowia lipolytica CLIB122]